MDKGKMEAEPKKEAEPKGPALEKNHSEGDMQIVLFSVHGKTFSMDINVVQDIIKLPEITPIPNSKDFIRGVINLRGRIIVVVDTGKKIGLEAVVPQKSSRVLITEIDDGVVGLLVDAVTEVIKVNPDEILPAPSSAKDKDYLKGVHILGERLVMVVDTDKLFRPEDYKNA